MSPLEKSVTSLPKSHGGFGQLALGNMFFFLSVFLFTLNAFDSSFL